MGNRKKDAGETKSKTVLEDGKETGSKSRLKETKVNAGKTILERCKIWIGKIGERSTYQRLNQMIDEAMDGTFSETDYEETEISKLEAKWKRFFISAKLSSQKVEEERKKIQELLSDISHQTKTPLANILLYSQLLEEQNLDETSRNLVAEIVKQSEKLEFLIQSLVKTSRLETGTFRFSPQKQELSGMLREIKEQAKQKAEKKNMQILLPEWEKDSSKQGTDSIKAVYDRKWTTEALYNILDNAVKYGNENSNIGISVHAYEMFVCITIRNEGEGISEEEIPLIFQRFYRGKYANETEGVGIGLYLARQIVEEQGGYIKVTSKGDGRIGFSVYLPRGR